jgi:hypothetical protein
MAAKVTSLYTRKLVKAAEELEPAVYDMYEQYGLVVSLTVLQYMTAKGIMGSKLTKEERADIVKEAKSNFDKFLVQLNKD